MPSENRTIAITDAPRKNKEPLLPRIISLILHPLLMGGYAVSLLFLYTDFNLLYAGQYIMFIVPVLFFTCIVPVSSIYCLQKSGLVGSDDKANTFDKMLPMLVVFFAYCLLIYYFSSRLYYWFLLLLAVPLILIVINCLISIKWKISVHMMAVGALIGSTLSICYNIKAVNPFILFIILFILAGCLGVARLMLKKETPAQVYMGFFIGIVISYLCILVGLKWEIMMFLRNLN